jgi:hypothetical protein
MSKCPVCDYPSDGVKALLKRIDDVDLLVTLTCDAIERIVDLSDIHGGHRVMMLEMREWRANPYLAKLDWDNGHDFALNGGIRVPTRVSWAADQAVWSVREAIEEADDSETERNWQLQHIAGLACTCPRIPEVGRPGDRGRTSLLAS